MYVFCYCQYPLLLLSLDRSSLSSLHCTGQEALTRECLCPCPDNSGSYHSLPLYVNEINVNINWPRFIFWRFSFCMKVYIGEGLSSSKKLRHRQLSLGKFSFCFFPKNNEHLNRTWITTYLVISIGSKYINYIDSLYV